MTLLIVGVISWWVVHLLPILARPTRDHLAASMGEGPYKGVYALVTLGTIALMVIGYQQAPFVNLWFPPMFLVHVNNLLMLLAVAVFIAKDIPSPVRRWLRHPQFTAVKIWALAHLLVNGDLASVILFGGMLGWAVVAMIGTNRRDGSRGSKPEATVVGTVLHVVAALAILAVVGWVHGSLLGVWPFAGGPPTG